MNEPAINGTVANAQALVAEALEALEPLFIQPFRLTFIMHREEYEDGSQDMVVTNAPDLGEVIRRLEIRETESST